MSARRDLSKCAVEHGYNRYTYGCRCAVCKAAKATYMREKRAVARTYTTRSPGRTVIPGIKHGTAGYKDHLCRCDTCIGARRAEEDRRKARIQTRSLSA